MWNVNLSQGARRATTLLGKRWCALAALPLLLVVLHLPFPAMANDEPGSAAQHPYQKHPKPPNPPACGEPSPVNKGYKVKSVRIEDVGDNWQYARDADKLPIMRKAMASGRLRMPPRKGTVAPFCKTFPKDFLAGRFEVIEPDFQALSEDDPRLGAIPVFNRVTGDYVPSLDDPRVHWHRCDAINQEDSTAKEDSKVFMGFSSMDLPPYRFYRVEMDRNRKNGPKEVALYRETGNGYSHDYLWVDLKGCEIRQSVQVTSPKSTTYPEYRDALSLLIRYRGRVMVLSYKDWAKRVESERQASVMLVDFVSADYCDWDEPSSPEK